jgi:hypothetical protein
MKIDCVMGTYGRYSLACETLVCFLQQSALSQATLLIYNQHPVPLHFEHPRVRVINEIEPPQALRYLKQRMFELADPTADFSMGWKTMTFTCHGIWRIASNISETMSRGIRRRAGCRRETSSFRAASICSRDPGCFAPTI